MSSATTTKRLQQQHATPRGDSGTATSGVAMAKGAAAEVREVSLGGWVLPAIGLSVGVLTLVLTYVLAMAYAPGGSVEYWFISQMGSNRPAYFFYAYGCCLAAGLLIPCAWIFAAHNASKLRTDLSLARRILNSLSMASGIVSVLALGGQSVYPMGDGNPIHIGFASLFFLGVWLHSLLTAFLYTHAYRDPRVVMGEHEGFWVQWKALFTALTSVFTVLTVGVLAFDGWLHLDEGLTWGPTFVTWLTAEKEKSAWMMSGAVCEYLTVASLLCYFISYFHDLTHVQVVVHSSPVASSPAGGRKHRRQH
jgi:hypothetical protein